MRYATNTLHSRARKVILLALPMSDVSGLYAIRFSLSKTSSELTINLYATYVEAEPTEKLFQKKGSRPGLQVSVVHEVLLSQATIQTTIKLEQEQTAYYRYYMYKHSEQKSITQMERALDDLEMRLALIPEHEKEEYIEALEKCPGLVLTESDPIRFLRFTNFNAPAAAISLTRYWKARKEAFGREKAFLPLALTPNSALDEYVLDWIRSGVSLTPLKDSFGRTLVIFDTTRRINISRDRSSYLFYLHQHAMENDLSQTDGYVMIIIVGDDFEVSSTHHDTVLKFMNIFPIRIKAWHCVRRDGNVSMNAMQAFLVKTYYKIFRGHAVHFHNEASGQAPVDSLACYGISKSVLPRRLEVLEST